MSIMTPELSLAVGWDREENKQIAYPTVEEVKSAGHYDLLRWYRFLRSPENKEQREAMALICYRFKEEDPE